MSMFDGTQREIGKGAQAKVFYYNGYAYKVYEDGYPVAWVAIEMDIQNEINKTGLPAVKYYKTGEPNIIKMDYIDGITLGSRIRKENYNNGIEDMIELQKKVHMAADTKLPAFKTFAEHDLNEIRMERDRTDKALKFMEEIPDKHSLLHLDFHFLNIMYTGEKYYIIDWNNARTGNPVYDFARTYVIINEFEQDLAGRYLSLLMNDRDIDMADWKKAVYVMAVLRTREHSDERTLELIDAMEKELLMR